MLLFALAQGLMSINVIASADPYNKRVGSLVASNTSPSEKLVVLSYTWGGEVFLHSEREGLNVAHCSLTENPETLRKLQLSVYTKFVWVSELPLLYALQATSPGEADRQKDGFPVDPPASTSAWPLVHQSPDVVIKDLPRR